MSIVYSICQKTFVDGILRFDRDQDPDDMRLFANPSNPIDTKTGKAKLMRF